MNENVQILEGNTTRRISPIDKVEVDTTTEGETSMWVPKDDHKTGVLHASENGIYIASEDGYDSYSEIVVRVEKRIDDGDLIDESGVDWQDIDYDGDIGDFDELDIWDEDTLEEYADDLETFDELFNDKDFWDEEKEKPITEDEMDDFTGDSISGIDPEDGNVYEYSVDEDGNLTEAMLPSAIHIVIAPRKKDYVAGETIDFSGIHVYLLDGNNHLFTNEQYPTGEIPFEELLFPVTTAEGDGSGASKRSDDDGITVIELHGFIEEIGVDQICTGFGTINGVRIQCSLPINNVIIYLTRYQNYIYTAGITNDQPLGSLWLWAGNSSLAAVAQFNTKSLVGRYSYDYKEVWSFVPESTKDPTGIDPESLEEVCIEIPVQWMRSDGEMLEDKFLISVSNTENAVSLGSSTNPINNNESGHTSGGF